MSVNRDVRERNKTTQRQRNEEKETVIGNCWRRPGNSSRYKWSTCWISGDAWDWYQWIKSSVVSVIQQWTARDAGWWSYRQANWTTSLEASWPLAELGHTCPLSLSCWICSLKSLFGASATAALSLLLLCCQKDLHERCWTFS